MSEETPLIQLIDSAPEDTPPVSKAIVSGAISGAVQVLVGQPFDITKVRMQSSSTPTSASEIVKHLYKAEGVRGFYRGTTTPLLGVGAEVAVQFAVNEACKKYFTKMNGGGRMSLTQFYVSGALAGFADAFLACPIEHIRIRLQTSSQFASPLHCYRELVKNGQLFKGFWPTVIRGAHGYGVYFLTFEALVANEMKRLDRPRSGVEAWKMCLFGALSGYTLWLAVYPIDVIKSKFQVDSLTQPKYKSIMGCAKSIYAEAGYRGFFKGIGPTMLRAAPANGATFVAFEMCMRYL